MKMREHTKGLITGVIITLLFVGIAGAMELSSAWNNKEYWDHWVQRQCEWSSKPLRCWEVMCGVNKGLVTPERE